MKKIICVILILFLIGCSEEEIVEEKSNFYINIVGASVDVYESLEETHIMGQVYLDSVYQVLLEEEVNDVLWYQIKINDTKGWVDSKYAIRTFNGLRDYRPDMTNLILKINDYYEVGTTINLDDVLDIDMHQEYYLNNEVVKSIDNNQPGEFVLKVILSDDLGRSKHISQRFVVTDGQLIDIYSDIELNHLVEKIIINDLDENYEYVGLIYDYENKQIVNHYKRADLDYYIHNENGQLELCETIYYDEKRYPLDQMMNGEYVNSIGSLELGFLIIYLPQLWEGSELQIIDMNKHIVHTYYAEDLYIAFDKTHSKVALITDTQLNYTYRPSKKDLVILDLSGGEVKEIYKKSLYTTDINIFEWDEATLNIEYNGPVENEYYFFDVVENNIQRQITVNGTVTEIVDDSDGQELLLQDDWMNENILDVFDVIEPSADVIHQIKYGDIKTSHFNGKMTYENKSIYFWFDIETWDGKTYFIKRLLEKGETVQVDHLQWVKKGDDQVFEGLQNVNTDGMKYGLLFLQYDGIGYDGPAAGYWFSYNIYDDSRTSFIRDFQEWDDGKLSVNDQVTFACTYNNGYDDNAVKVFSIGATGVTLLGVFDTPDTQIEDVQWLSNKSLKVSLKDHSSYTIVFSEGYVRCAEGVVQNQNLLPHLARIRTGDINFRSGPSTEYDITEQSTIDDVYLIVDIEDDSKGEVWYQFQSGEWLKSDFVDSVNVSHYTVEVTADVLNVRSFAGLYNEVVDQIKKGDKVQVMGKGSSFDGRIWYKIGEEKWIDSQYTSLNLQ